MNRRAFLRRLVAAAIRVALVRELPGIAPTQVKLAFDPQAFVRCFDELSLSPARFDVLFGFGVINKDRLKSNIVASRFGWGGVGL